MWELQEEVICRINIIDAYMNVDLNAVASNFKVFSTLHPNKTVMAVVKANAYGLGSVKVARHLMENGATFLL